MIIDLPNPVIVAPVSVGEFNYSILGISVEKIYFQGGLMAL